MNPRGAPVTATVPATFPVGQPDESLLPEPNEPLLEQHEPLELPEEPELPELLHPAGVSNRLARAPRPSPEAT
jgi:hypothetical protein